MAGKRVVPLCHGGMSPADLPEPLRSLQAYELSNPQHFQDLVGQLAQEAGLRPPHVDAKLMDRIPRVETSEELELIHVPEIDEMVGTGWLMPTADARDFTIDHEEIRDFAKRLHIPTEKKSKLPKAVDLRQWCSTVRNQGKLNSGTAHAVVAMTEYLERRAFGRSVDLSRLFVYKQARNLMHRKGDCGASLRSTLRAVRICGVPPSEFWPYTDKKPEFDEEPPASVYATGFNYGATRFFCHDPVHMHYPTQLVLAKVKALLAAGVPSAFGILLFPSFGNANCRGGVPFPCSGEDGKWRQAVLAVGYDDNVRIKNTRCGVETVGALLVQNSWGHDWGDNGYGWIPYKLVIEGKACDFWSVLSCEWIDTLMFGL